MNKNPPLLPMIIICRFERICGTFRGGGKKNTMSLMTLSQFVEEKKKKKNVSKKKLNLKNNNDHGVDVNIILVT
jgi:hypothetical protein